MGSATYRVWIGGTEMADHLGVDVSQHGIDVKGTEASAVHLVERSPQTRGDHCLSSVAMRRTNALAQAVIQGVVEVEDYAANQRPLARRSSSLTLLALS